MNRISVTRKASVWSSLTLMACLWGVLAASTALLADDDIEVEGVIQSIGQDSLVVRSMVFFVDSQTEIRGPHGPIQFSDLRVGHFVEVRADVQSDSTNLATRIELNDDVEVEGRINALGSDNLTVDGLLSFVNGNTEIRGPHGTTLRFEDLNLGDSVEVRADLRLDGTYLATRIELEDEGEDLRTRGRIQEIGIDSLVVNQLVFFVNAATRIEGAHNDTLQFSDLMVGDSVEVRAVRRPDSTLLATRIELENENPDTTADGRIQELHPDFLVLTQTRFDLNSATTVLSLNGDTLTMQSVQVSDTVQINAATRPDGSHLAVTIRLMDLTTGIDGDGSQAPLPAQFVLGQNYPNPFNPTTIIPVAISGAAFRQVELRVYNILGQQVQLLFSGLLDAGSYQFSWDGRNQHGALLPGGGYFYQLKVDGRIVQTRRMIFLK